MSQTTQASSLTWIQKILGLPPPGVAPPPPITSPEMIPARRAAIGLDRFNVGLPDVAIEEVVLRERDGLPLRAEVLRPRTAGTYPAVLYMHGGAWCVWSAHDVRRITTNLAAGGHVVLSLDYGLAPERPFPWAIEDTIYAARWLVGNGRRFGADVSRLATGGDSCGATLAASAMAFLGGLDADLDEGDLAGVDVDFYAAVFHCGAFDLRARLNERDTTPGTTEIMASLAYLGTRFLGKQLDPMVSPYYAGNLGSFPPVYMNVGNEDALVPQTFSMATKLIDECVPTTVSVLPKLDHEFLLLPNPTPAIGAEWDRMLAWLRERADDAGLP